MFEIDLKSRLSIYEQVIENVKRLIFSGVLQSDTRLPSVRELSKTLTVNPNTVQKAYRELERQGMIYTVSGRGCFVAPQEEAGIDEEKVSAMFEEMKSLITELLYIGVEPETIRTELENLLRAGTVGKE